MIGVKNLSIMKNVQNSQIFTQKDTDYILEKNAKNFSKYLIAKNMNREKKKILFSI